MQNHLLSVSSNVKLASAITLCSLFFVLAILMRSKPSNSIALRSIGGFTQLAPKKKPLKGSRHKWQNDLNDDMPGRREGKGSSYVKTPGHKLRRSESSHDILQPIHNWNALGDDVIR